MNIEENIKILKSLIIIAYNREMIMDYNFTTDYFIIFPKLKEIFNNIQNDPFYQIEKENIIQENIDKITQNFIDKVKTQKLSDITKGQVAEQLKNILNTETRQSKINNALLSLFEKYSKNEEITTQDIDILNSSYNFNITPKIKDNFYTLNDLSKIYEDKLRKRPENKFYSFGLSKIDKIMPQGALPGEITILGGSTSMGKSVVALNMLNNKIDLDEPCIYISTEMGIDSTMDRFFCLRHNKTIPNLHISIDIKNTMPARYTNYMNTIQDWDRDNKFKSSKNIRAYFEAKISFSELRELIRQYKKETKNDYCYVIIDILTMITEFNKTPTNLASSYSVAMDELESIAKDEGVHILGIVHFNRESDKTKILSLKDIEKVRPNIASVKNSSTIVDRARNFISCFCEEYYISRYLQEDQEALTYIEENGITIELQLLKSSNSQSGLKVEYTYDKEHFKLIDNGIFSGYMNNTISNIDNAENDNINIDTTNNSNGELSSSDILNKTIENNKNNNSFISIFGDIH